MQCWVREPGFFQVRQPSSGDPRIHRSFFLGKAALLAHGAQLVAKVHSQVVGRVKIWDRVQRSAPRPPCSGGPVIHPLQPLHVDGKSTSSWYRAVTISVLSRACTLKLAQSRSHEANN